MIESPFLIMHSMHSGSCIGVVILAVVCASVAVYAEAGAPTVGATGPMVQLQALGDPCECRKLLACGNVDARDVTDAAEVETFTLDDFREIVAIASPT